MFYKKYGVKFKFVYILNIVYVVFVVVGMKYFIMGVIRE